MVFLLFKCHLVSKFSVIDCKFKSKRAVLRGHKKFGSPKNKIGAWKCMKLASKNVNFGSWKIKNCERYRMVPNIKLRIRTANASKCLRENTNALLFSLHWIWLSSNFSIWFILVTILFLFMWSGANLYM